MLRSAMVVERTDGDPGRGDDGARRLTTRRTLGLLLFLVAALALAGCPAMDDGGDNGTGDGDGPYNVEATGSLVFDPDTLTVNVGETVRWTVTDGASHTVTSTSVPSGASMFDSGNLDPGDTFEVTFDTAGTYEYRCEYHSSASNGGYSGMTGTITVVE